MQVKFYDEVNDALLKFAVIIAIYNGKLVLCKHKERETYEIPGGHRENGEAIEETARRELSEETGAVDFVLRPVCVYYVTGKNRVNESGEETFGMLFFAEIKTFEHRLHSEMESIKLFNELPENLTYPDIQPFLLNEFLRRKDGI
ncbi:MAG: NUDIX domain-containing protein [Oscillospiraceae bacterium]|nr:NUDIX domain-containing protein [Oscillospiraceae bacterium]